MARITVLAILAIILTVSIVEMPQVAIGSNVSKNISDLDEKFLKKQVLHFLTTWLIDRDFVKAIDSFSDRAFSNEAIFNESCSGIRDEVRNSAEAMRKELEIFLMGIEDFPASNDLNTALNVNNLLPFKRLKSKSASSMELDRFLLLRVKTSDITKLASGNRARKFLKEYFKSEQLRYLSIIPIGDEGGIMYFVWEKDGEIWKISHASLECM